MLANMVLQRTIIAAEHQVVRRHCPICDRQRRYLSKEITVAPHAALDAASWWATRRFRYNVGLLLAGGAAFVLYAIAFELRCLNVPEAEITLFTTAFQGIGYLICVAIANLFYNLGQWSEALVKPRDAVKYRRRVFNLGFWFSVTLPFSIPLIIFVFGCA